MPCNEDALELEEVQGQAIAQGRAALAAQPDVYEALLFPTSMQAWPAERRPCGANVGLHRT